MRRYTDPNAASYLLDAEACCAVIKELDRLVEKFQRKVKREEAGRRQDLETALGYESEQDIQEAYGWGFITEAQYNKYLDLYREGEEAMTHRTPTRAELALSILCRIRRDLVAECEEWELSALTPEEQAAELKRRREAAQEWRQKIKRLKEQTQAGKEVEQHDA